MANSQDIINTALSVFSTQIQKDFAGVAFLKQAEVRARQPDEQVRAIRNHVTYRRRADRSRAMDTFDRTDPDGQHDVTQVDVADVIATLAPTDRAIVAAILAGSTFREAGEAAGISAATVSRRLKALRTRFAGGLL